jgi:hypothetical protein
MMQRLGARGNIRHRFVAIWEVDSREAVVFVTYRLTGGRRLD